MVTRSLLQVVLCTVLLGAIETRGENWPQFRGPGGQGIVEGANLPMQWSETENVRWKVGIHGKAWSSPVTWGEQIWLTTATEDGKELSVICVDLNNGEILRDDKLFDVEDPQFCHKFNSYASPTPVIEAGRVYVTFGSPGTACIDTRTGKVLWERRDLECNHYRGSGSSPIVFGDLLIMNFDGSDQQYIVALNKQTGETVWKTPRSIDFQDLDANGNPESEGDWRKGFSTPHIATFDGQEVLLSIGAKALYAYEPLSGRDIWRTESREGHSGGTRPTIGENAIYYCTGFGRGEIWAVKPGGKGVVNDTHVLWDTRRGVPNKPSLILDKGLIYMINDGGVAGCVEEATGEGVYQERVGGNYSASPILSGDRMYVFSEEGKTSIIQTGREFKILATNELGDGFMASPAVVGDDLILRSKSHLYRVGE